MTRSFPVRSNAWIHRLPKAVLWNEMLGHTRAAWTFFIKSSRSNRQRTLEWFFLAIRALPYLHVVKISDNERRLILEAPCLSSVTWIQCWQICICTVGAIGNSKGEPIAYVPDFPNVQLRIRSWLPPPFNVQLWNVPRATRNLGRYLIHSSTIFSRGLSHAAGRGWRTVSVALSRIWVGRQPARVFPRTR